MLTTFNLQLTIDEEQVKGLFQLFKYSISPAKPTKGKFLSYIRSQLRQFGTGDCLLSEMGEYKELTYEDIAQLIEWNLV